MHKLIITSCFHHAIAVDNFNAGTRFSFSLRFRTAFCSGVLIYVHSLLFPDHVVVEMFNGTVSNNLAK